MNWFSRVFFIFGCRSLAESSYRSDPSQRTKSRQTDLPCCLCSLSLPAVPAVLCGGETGLKLHVNAQIRLARRERIRIQKLALGEGRFPSEAWMNWPGPFVSVMAAGLRAVFVWLSGLDGVSVHHGRPQVRPDCHISMGSPPDRFFQALRQGNRERRLRFDKPRQHSRLTTLARPPETMWP